MLLRRLFRCASRLFFRAPSAAAQNAANSELVSSGRDQELQDDLLDRLRQELSYWRSRLDDIASEWFKNLLSVSGASVALIALAFATGINVGSVAYTLIFPVLPIYLNNFSALGWNARETLRTLQLRYKQALATYPKQHRKMVWGSNEVRAIPRKVPGAGVAAVSLVLLLVPGYIYSVNYLVKVFPLEFFSGAPSTAASLNIATNWGLVVLSVSITIWNVALVFLREMRGYWKRDEYD